MDRPGLNRVVIAEFDRLAFLTPLEIQEKKSDTQRVPVARCHSSCV